MKIFCLTVFALFSVAHVGATGSPVVIASPSQDRWVYPSNSTPGTRAQASTFSALPGSSGLDERWGFFLFAFDTAAAVPPGLPPEIYRIQSVKVTATISQNLLFAYDPTYDSWQTYATPEVPAALADPDLGRPLELHGAGFRGIFTPATFLETSPYGSSIPGTRNAFPRGFDASGASRDVSSNVTGQFESIPWAVGKTDVVSPGDSVPIDTVFNFSLDTSSPGVTPYLRDGLAAGRVWFSLTSLHPATQQSGEFVSYYTRDDPYHQLFGGLAPSLSMETEIDLPVTVTRSADTVTLAWPQYAGITHTLQASGGLTGDSWLPIHSHAATVNGTGGFSEITTAPVRFYRLALTKTP
ncbi:MAG: hypothetical protein ACRCXD_12315 [Luteolibacter sp.]